jgi:hypothetical protein
VDPVTRRFLIANLLLLPCLALILALGPLVPGTPAQADPERPTFTLDRGGIVRFNNGKVGVETAFDFNLDDGPSQVPLKIGRWEGVDFPLNLEAYESIWPELLINRAYRNSVGENVSLTVIGSNASRKLHRPEICYRAADWTLTELPTHTVALDSGAVGLGRLHARSQIGEERMILYWYLWRDDRRRIEDGAYVIQVAASLTNQSAEEAMTASERFVRQLLRQTVDRTGIALQFPLWR